MQTQEASEFVLFKLWPWIEANTKRIGIGIGIATTAAFLISFYFWQQNQKEITAGWALTQLIVNTPPDANPSNLADSYLQIANMHPGTQAAQRALLQSAMELFAANRYADAQTEFQKFLDTQPDGKFSSQATLGVAASLEAQGKVDPAINTYESVINGFADPMAASNAKFALARIYESRGKITDARNFYEEVARANPNNSLGSEAELRAMELKTKPSSSSSSTVQSTPFNLSQ